MLDLIQGAQGEGDREEEEEVRFPTNTGLTGLAISRKEIVIRHNPETGKDPDFDMEVDRNSCLPSVTLIMGPIMGLNQSGNPIGVLQVRICTSNALRLLLWYTMNCSNNVSDTVPNYLRHSTNDPNSNLMLEIDSCSQLFCN